MKRKIYFIQPTYRTFNGKLLQGRFILVHSCAIAALAAATPEGWEYETCLEYFEDVNYDTDASIVAINTMGYDIFHGREIGEEFRRRGKIVLFGGYQAHLSRELIKDVANCIVYGYPGPAAMSRILQDAADGCLKSTYDAGIDINFPFDYSMMPNRRILFMPILASVGCRNNCDFCCTAARHNGHYRLRRIKHVVSDLQAIQDHTRRFFVVDCNIYNNRSYLLSLCHEIERTGHRFLWAADATVDIGEDDEALNALHKSGCRLLYIGLETPNQRSLNAVHKPYEAVTYASAIKNIKAHGIAVAGFFMVGLDGETTETFDELFDFIHDTRVNLPILNMLVPVPGTTLYQRLEQEGRLKTNALDRYLKNAIFFGSSAGTCFHQPSGMTAYELEKGLTDLRLRLASPIEVVRRSLIRNPILAALLLVGNTQILRESRRHAAAWQARQSADFTTSAVEKTGATTMGT